MPKRKHRPRIDCTCDGRYPYCAPCVLAHAITMRIAHPATLSVGMLKRRLPQLTGREAAIVLEASKMYGR